MRILLLKSLLLCTNCPSFPPILCGILLFLPWIPFCFCRGIVSAVELFLPWILFVSTVESFLFLPWIPLCIFLLPFCFCRGYLCFYSFFLFVFAVDLFLPLMSFCIFLLSFCFSLFSLVPSIFSHEIRKTWEFFQKKSIVFLKISIVFLFFSEMLRSYHAFKCACERKSMPSINPSA